MYPLKDWKTAKRGYTFLQPTFYGTKHTGLDIMVSYVDYFAPFSGMATKGSGKEGGNWWQLVRDDGVKFIVRHLSQTLKVGKVQEGEKVAVTGNTGLYTTAPHAHQEVYINGKLVNPETFNWTAMKPTYIEQDGKIGIYFDYGQFSVIQWATDPEWGNELSEHFLPEGDVLKISKK